MCTPRWQPGLQGQHRRGPAQRLDLRLLIHAQHHRVLRWRHYNPTTSTTLATNSGSVENLNVSVNGPHITHPIRAGHPGRASGAWLIGRGIACFVTETAASSAGPTGSQAGAIFEHVPHPHIAARKVVGPAKTSDMRTKGKGPIGRLNARFGVFITVAVGTMWGLRGAIHHLLRTYTLGVSGLVGSTATAWWTPHWTVEGALRTPLNDRLANVHSAWPRRVWTLCALTPTVSASSIPTGYADRPRTAHHRSEHPIRMVTSA